MLMVWMVWRGRIEWPRIMDQNIKNGLFLKIKLRKSTSGDFYPPLNFKCGYQISKYYNCKMERDDPIKKKSQDNRNRHDSQGSEPEDSYISDGYESSFVANDSEVSGQYDMPYRGNLSDDQSKQRKSKKQKKKDKKKEKKEKRDKKDKRERRMKEDDSYDEDDLDLIDNTNKLTRLKKKKQYGQNEDQENQGYGDPLDDDDDYISDDNDAQSYSVVDNDDQQEEYSKMNQFIEPNKEIFDPFDLKSLALADQDRQIVQIDLPQRYVNLLKANMRGQKKKLSQVRQILQKQDHAVEANWIYYKIKSQGYLQSFDERECKQRIKRILQCYHKEHLDIMYIYMYRKKIFSDYISLQILWKIQEFDQQWLLFRERQKKILKFLETTLASYTQVHPELLEMINQIFQAKFIKYFDDYQRFMLARYTSTPKQQLGLQNQRRQFQDDRDNMQQGRVKKIKTNLKSNNKLDFIAQMALRGLIQQLQHSQIFLSPRDLCFNLNKKTQERKPKSPNSQPSVQFQKFMGTSNPEGDKLNFPLLVGSNIRLNTIAKYLSYELYCYPQVRRLLRQKYYKKLVISTNPTPRGNQDIDLYNIFFPVKRIREKPVSTLRREIWILARQAQRLGHIKLNVKFEWEQIFTERTQRTNLNERDVVYMQIIKSYYDISSKNAESWNILRKRIINSLLLDYFIPSFMKQIKEDLTREGEKQIIQACCAKLKSQLNKGPSLKEGNPIKILSLVLQDVKLGVAFVDQAGKPLHTFQTIISNDIQLKDFVSGENLKYNIKQYKPDMILIAANCKKAQTLRKQLRSQDFNYTIFCAFGQYQVPRLVAKKRIIQGFIEEQAIIEAISMARLKKNPMAQIISLWSDKTNQNGILSINLHPYQRFINQNALKESLQKIIIEIVNLVGLDLNEIKRNQHNQNQLQFISGLGPKKSQHFLEKLKEQNTQILCRRKIQQIVRGEIVAKNCASFLKIETSFHKTLFEKLQKQKKGNPIVEYESINLLDMTRIPQEWYKPIIKKITEGYKLTTLSEMRSRKQFAKLSDENIYLLQIFKNPERIRAIDWRVKENIYFDDELVKSQIMSRFKNPRDKERVMQNNEIFYNLLRQTPDTLKRYIIMPVKVLSVKKNYLNVIITENGLFGYIKLQSNKSAQEYQKIYQKGTIIKAIIIGFPFDEKNQTARQQAPTEQQQLLKVEMGLDFPHKDSDRHEGSRHDCMALCFPSIVKDLHPLIDLDKDRFQLKKQDKPTIQNREQKEKTQVNKNISKPDFRRISHPKFKNISAQPAIELMKNVNNGDYVIRPSSQGPQYLTITWKFFNKVIVHIKIRCEHRAMNSMNMTYRIEDKDNRSYNSLEQIVEKCIKPMNTLVQDVISNRKFLDRNLQEIQNTIKRDMITDGSHIYYYFGVSQDYPQYFLLIYMYKEKKPVRELIKVKSSGLYFHDQQFSNVRDLITWFKEHLKEKEYQKYVKNMNAQMQKMR